MAGALSCSLIDRRKDRSGVASSSRMREIQRSPKLLQDAFFSEVKAWNSAARRTVRSETRLADHKQAARRGCIGRRLSLVSKRKIGESSLAVEALLRKKQSKSRRRNVAKETKQKSGGNQPRNSRKWKPSVPFGFPFQFTKEENK